MAEGLRLVVLISGLGLGGRLGQPRLLLLELLDVERGALDRGLRDPDELLGLRELLKARPDGGHLET